MPRRINAAISTREIAYLPYSQGSGAFDMPPEDLGPNNVGGPVGDLVPGSPGNHQVQPESECPQTMRKANPSALLAQNAQHHMHRD